MDGSLQANRPALSASSRPGLHVRLAMLVLSLGAISAELVIVMAMLRVLTPLSSLLLGQLALSGILLWNTLVLYRCGGRDPAFLLLMIATVFMGPLGAVGAGSSIILRWWFARRATPFEQWYSALFPTPEISPTRALYERIVLRGGGPGLRSNVAPFTDVMVLGTVQQKQAVIGLIADEFRPAFAPALRSALNDTEPAIRVQAATASARIENRFLERALTLEEQRAAVPDNPDHLLALARHHETYALTGLLDAGRAQSERRQALDCYRRVAQLRPEHPGIAEAMGRLLLRLDQPAQALAYLEPLASGAMATPEMLAWYLEALYRLGQIDQLRRAARQHGARIAASTLPREIRESVELWVDAADIRQPSLGDTR
jgi:hypothetical protein